MISMARIQGHSLGHAGWQRPIFPMELGQNGNGMPGPAPAPAVSPAVVDLGPSFPAYPTPIYPPNYAYFTETAPTTTAAPAATPTWLLVAGGLAAGIALALLLKK